MISRFKNLSLLWRILLSTSVAITVLFAITGWAVQNYAVHVSEQSLEDEVRTSMEAFQALWTSRTHTLASLSRVISAMSDVRAAFMTLDQATIRDSVGELWSRISDEDSVFLVLDPAGELVTSLGPNPISVPMSPATLQRVGSRFPSQVAGFVQKGNGLFYVVLTPVYVQSSNGQALINILLAGVEVNDKLATVLKQSTRGSDFAFIAGDEVIASTMPRQHAYPAHSQVDPGSTFQHFSVNGEDRIVLSTPLLDVEGNRIGALQIMRSVSGPQHALGELQRNVGIVWLIAILAGLTFTYLMAKRVVEPVKRLDRAATEVARRNYDYRLPVDSDDELGRLAHTFNEMCESIIAAREELIRHERIATIGRISSSIVHDLRNPLASIYAGAEMLVDSDLHPSQAKRLAQSIYRASRRIQELLQDLVNTSRGRGERLEACRLADVIGAASEVVAPTADSQRMQIEIEIPDEIQISVERARMERVFINLMNNSLEAMPRGGQLRITCTRGANDVTVAVDDTGPGVASSVREIVFQPFASTTKRNGLGLGLALSRQTLLDHGGDMWLEEKGTPGARFCLRIPCGADALNRDTLSEAHGRNA